MLRMNGAPKIALAQEACATRHGIVLSLPFQIFPLLPYLRYTLSSK